MKKTYIVLIILAVLALAVGVWAFVMTNDAVKTAERAHAAVYQEYCQMRSNAEQTSLTVTEDGVITGTYTLAQLGVLNDTLERVNRSYADLDRLDPESFSSLSSKEKMNWSRQPQPVVTVDLTHLDVFEPMEDLVLMTRTPSKDAYVEFLDGDFVVHDEIWGNQLQVKNIQNAMAASMEGLSFSPDAPGQARFEVTDCDCYIQPERTKENAYFNFDAMLQDRVEHMTVTLDFHGQTEILEAEQLSGILSVSEKGQVQVDAEALARIAAAWNETHKKQDVEYLFNAYVGGVKPIEFLKVDYEVDQAALVETLTHQLEDLQDLSLTAPWLCWRDGEAFAIEGEYIEVDIPNQVMTYVKDGEVLVSTDIVTGATWGYPTPTGYYTVQNKDTDCWLSGPDYNVHVDYWVGFIGYTYGLHDADWRTKFGGENYIRNGSHGCVNTPKEAMKIIHETVEVGVPLLVYGK